MQYRNILIVKLSAIGDIIHALPVAAALKAQYPDVKLTWIVERPGMDLVTDNPCVDEVILFDKPRYKSFSGFRRHSGELSKLLHEKHFDLALDLHGLFKSAAVSYLSGAPVHLGYCDLRELSHFVSRRICGPHRHGHVVERCLDVARYLGCTISEVKFPLGLTPEVMAGAETAAKEAGFSLEDRFIVLAPGTNWPSKCWPTRHFAELASALAARGILPVLIGGPNDQPLAQEIIDRSNSGAKDLTGHTTLRQLAYLIKKSMAFVGGDTGPMHLAVAVGAPVVTMFGPTDPTRNGPYHGNNVVIQADMPCIQCWKRRCDRHCMERISPQQVLAGLDQILAAGNGGCE